MLNNCFSQLVFDNAYLYLQALFVFVHCLDLSGSLCQSFGDPKWVHVYSLLLNFLFLCCHLFQKLWMIWGPVVAVALTAVTAAVLFRT